MPPRNNSEPTFTSDQLRWIAEAADGTRDRPLVLVREGADLKVLPEPYGGGGSVLLHLRTPSRGDGMAGKAHVRVIHQNEELTDDDLKDADAVFLSQSAIKKFLLPYYVHFMSPAQVQALENKLLNDETIVAAFHIPPSVTKPLVSAPDVKMFRVLGSTKERKCEACGIEEILKLSDAEERAVGLQ